MFGGWRRNGAGLVSSFDLRLIHRAFTQFRVIATYSVQEVVPEYCVPRVCGALAKDFPAIPAVQQVLRCAQDDAVFGAAELLPALATRAGVQQVLRRAQDDANLGGFAWASWWWATLLQVQARRSSAGCFACVGAGGGFRFGDDAAGPTLYVPLKTYRQALRSSAGASGWQVIFEPAGAFR